jgi:hypothetical protein
MFGHLDTGSLLSMGVLVAFLIGMLLPVRAFTGGARGAEPGPFPRPGARPARGAPG